MIKKIKTLFLILLLNGTLQAQYDAHKLEKIYADLFRADMLSYQLDTDLWFVKKGVYPYESEKKLRQDIDMMNALIDSITVNIPGEDEKLFKIHMKWKKSWEILSATLLSTQNNSPKYTGKLFNRFRSQRENFEKEILLFLSLEEPDQTLLNRIREVNNGVESVFKNYLQGQKEQKAYKTMIGYAESLLKVRKKFEKDKEINFLITNMVADLKTFGRAIDNGYKPEVIYRSHAKFNRKIFRLFDSIYPKLNK